MTFADRKTLFMALAFVAVTVQERETKAAAGQIRELAGLIEAFCMESLSGLFIAADNTGASFLDQVIDRHLGELRQEETTLLPDDKQMLIQLYDRLLHRKTQRSQREFYANASEAKLADLVLRLLDEELEDEERAALI